MTQTAAKSDEFTARDFQHVAQLLRSDDDKVVRASLSNWCNAIIAALDLAAVFEPALTAARAEEIYSSQLMRKFRDTLSNVKDGMEDEGDRIYFGSTNDADQLREIVDEVEELEWDRILASSQKKPDMYAQLRKLNSEVQALRIVQKKMDAARSALVRIADLPATVSHASEAVELYLLARETAASALAQANA